MRKLLLYALIGLMAFSCGEAQPDASLLGPTNIRVKNISLFDFDEVEVSAPGGVANYGPVAVQATSDYQSYSEAYRYAFIKVTIGDKDFILQPIDYVGESPLGVGNFTYVIDVPDLEGSGITLILSVD
ncbi:MAG: hypothetical protein ACR2MX_07590 [Cyclobacteriaceae bacterium]